MEKGQVPVEPPPQNRLQDLSKDIDDVTDTMNKTIGKMSNLQINTDGLLQRTVEMEYMAQHFKQTSQKVARSYWWKNVKLIVVIVVVVLIIVLIIVLLATGVIPVSSPVPPIVTPTSKP